MFSNEGEETIEAKIFIREPEEGEEPLLINLWDGSAEDIGGCSGSGTEQSMPQSDSLCISLKLEHCEMKLLILLDESQNRLAEKYRAEYGAVKNGKEMFLGDWTDKFQTVDSDIIPAGNEPGAMPARVFREGQCRLDASLSAAGVLNNASGEEASGTDGNTAIYRYTCVIPKENALTGAEYFTVRGEEMAECVCNGIFAGVSFYGPHNFKIGQLLKEGENEIFLRFTGNAVNLHGDVKVPFGLDC